MVYLDFEEVRRRINLAFVLQQLSYKPAGYAAKACYGPCPLQCCSSVGKRFWRRCCSFDLETNKWMCHACKKGGNQLDLFAQKHGVTVYDAALRLCHLAFIVPPAKAVSGPR